MSSIGSVSVEVVPDARNWAQKLREQIRDVTIKVLVEADTEAAKAKIDELGRDRTTTIDAQADTAEANLKLDEAARTRTATVKTKVDRSGLSRATLWVDGFIGKLSLIPALLATIGSTLVPLGATLGALTAGIAAPLAIAGGGAGLFAVLGGVAVAQAEKQLKAIDVIQKHLSTLTKGTAAYTDTQKQLKAAQDALPKSVGAFSDALGNLQSKFAQGGSMDALLKPITKGLGLLADLLPAIQPILKVVGDSFSTLIGELDKGAKSKGFADFIHQLVKQMGPDLIKFGHIFGNIAKGLSGLILAFGGKRLGGGLLDGLDRLTASFAKFGAGARHSQWLKDFIAYFHKVGPGVSSTLGALGTAFGHIVEALAPLGPKVLGIIKGVADEFNRIPIPVLTKVAEVVASLVVFQKLGGFKVAGFLTKGIGGATSGGGIKGAIGALTGGGVQKVFVVNMGEGGLGGGKGPTKTLLRDAGLPGLLLAGGLGTNDYINHTQGHAAANALANAGSGAGFGAGSVPASFVQDGPSKADIARAAASAHAFDDLLVGPLRDAANLKRSLGAVAQQSELTGHTASRSFAGADAVVQQFQKHLAAIHDKNVQIKVQEATALSALQRIQDYRIADKSFSVTLHHNTIEQIVGPGGGIGQVHTGGTPSHPSITPPGPPRPVLIQLDGPGGRSLSGFMHDHNAADKNYDRATGRH